MATVREWVSAQWILHDPKTEVPNKRFRNKTGLATIDIMEAKLYPSEVLSNFFPPQTERVNHE